MLGSPYSRFRLWTVQAYRLLVGPRATGPLIAADDALHITVNAHVAPLVIATADTTLLSTQSGTTVILNAAATKTMTLPAANAAGAGKRLRFAFSHQVATTSGNGHLIDPAGTDLVRGNGVTPAAGKGIVCTQATSRIGDSIVLESDGVSAWYIMGLTGTWAREA